MPLRFTEAWFVHLAEISLRGAFSLMISRRFEPSLSSSTNHSGDISSPTPPARRRAPGRHATCDCPRANGRILALVEPMPESNPGLVPVGGVWWWGVGTSAGVDPTAA